MRLKLQSKLKLMKQKVYRKESMKNNIVSSAVSIHMKQYHFQHCSYEMRPLPH